MTRLRKIVLPMALILLSMVIIAALSVSAVADDKDISRPGTTNKIKLDSADILEMLGFEVSDTERAYLALYGESSVSYGSHIPTSNVKLNYDSEQATLTVDAGAYEYESESGATVSWIPVKVVFEDAELEFSPSPDGRYTAKFDSFAESDDAVLNIIYRTGIDLSAAYINSLANKAYSDVLAWDEYKTYLDSLAVYEADKVLYQNYLVAKRVYDDNLAAYKVYLEDMAEYSTAKAEYDVYLAAMKVYNQEYERYLEYLEEKKEYDKKLELYNKYVENIETVKKQLAIIDGTMIASTSMHRSVYAAINGDLVKTVMENKDLIANEFVGANGDAVDNAGEATDALKTMYKEYLSQVDEKGKYTYYAINYQSFKDNFIKLFAALDKLYQNAKVRIAIDEEGYKVKFEIFLAQLYYTVNALSDTPVKNFDGDAYYDSSFQINRKTPLSILENQPYILDTGKATPLSSGYPTRYEMPTITEYNEPIKPNSKTEPIKPDTVENPGEAPTEVIKPVAPSFVSAPFGLSNGEPLPDAAQSLVLAYRDGAVFQRTPRESGEKINFEISVNKKVFGAKDIVVSFCDTDGNLIYSTVAEQGSYAEFIGAIPSKQETAAAVYVFGGWVNSQGVIVDITSIKSDTDITLYPYFEETVKLYDVYWQIDGNIVVTKCPYGEIPSLGYTPTRPSTERYYYTFSGWHKEISAVIGDSQADRYFALFDKEYILPAFNGSTPLGGGSVVENGNSLEIDCTPENVGDAYTDLHVDLSYILTRVEDFSAFKVKAQGYVADFSYTDAAKMKESDAQYFAVSSSSDMNRFAFTPTLLSSVGTPIDDSVAVTLSFSGLAFAEPEAVKIYKIENGERQYLRGNISAGSLSITVPCGSTYYAVAEYEAEILPSGPVSLAFAGNSALCPGERLEIKYTVPNGVLLKSLYMIDRNGVRSEITDNTVIMPVGGCTVGADYEYIEYTVNFISSGKIIGTRVYRYGEIPEMPANPIKTADASYTYTFDKWMNSSTGTYEILPVTSNVNYEALYTKTPIPVKEPTDELLISEPVLRKLTAAAFFGGFILLVFIPCAVIIAVKTINRAQRRSPRKVRKSKK